jgi:hypothetical protein
VVSDGKISRDLRVEGDCGANVAVYRQMYSRDPKGIVGVALCYARHVEEGLGSSVRGSGDEELSRRRAV